MRHGAAPQGGHGAAAAHDNDGDIDGSGDEEQDALPAGAGAGAAAPVLQAQLTAEQEEAVMQGMMIEPLRRRLLLRHTPKDAPAVKLVLAVGCRVALTVNVATSLGLVNGALGTVVGFRSYGTAQWRDELTKPMTLGQSCSLRWTSMMVSHLCQAWIELCQSSHARHESSKVRTGSYVSSCLCA